MGAYARAKTFNVSLTYKVAGVTKTTTATIAADSKAEALCILQSDIRGDGHSFTITNKSTSSGATANPTDIAESI